MMPPAMSDEEAALWKAEIAAAAKHIHFGALLRAACATYAARTGASYTDIATAAGLHQSSLSRAFATADASADVIRRVCATIGASVEIVTHK